MKVDLGQGIAHVTLSLTHTHTHIRFNEIYPSATPIKAFATPIKALFSDPHQSDPQSPHITSDP